MEGTTDTLRVRHEIAPGDPDDFRVRNLQEIAAVRSAATDTMTWLRVGIAVVSARVLQWNPSLRQ